MDKQELIKNRKNILMLIKKINAKNKCVTQHKTQDLVYLYNKMFKNKISEIDLFRLVLTFKVEDFRRLNCSIDYDISTDAFKFTKLTGAILQVDVDKLKKRVISTVYENFNNYLDEKQASLTKDFIINSFNEDMVGKYTICKDKQEFLEKVNVGYRKQKENNPYHKLLNVVKNHTSFDNLEDIMFTINNENGNEKELIEFNKELTKVEQEIDTFVEEMDNYNL